MSYVAKDHDDVEKAGERTRQGIVKTSLSAAAMSLQDVMKERSKSIIADFLLDRSKLYWKYALLQHRLCNKFGAIRKIMKEKMKVFRTGMQLIIREIEDAYQWVKQRIRLMKTSQKKQFEWLMEELKPIANLMS